MKNMIQRMPELLIKVAIVLVVIGVIYKLCGFGRHDVGPLGVSPDAFLRFSNTLLFFSIAVNVQRFIAARKAVASEEKQAEPPQVVRS